MVSGEKILVIGAGSMTGYHVVSAGGKQVTAIGNPRSAADRRHGWERVDLDDEQAVARMIDRYQPATIIYCHAVCEVKRCEKASQWARRVNVGNLSRLLDRLDKGARVVYVSSDHVFGEGGTVDEHSPPAPISVYGRTRVEAERLVLARRNSLVVRSGLAIGPSADGQSGHWDWLAYRSERGLAMTVIEDECRSVVSASAAGVRVLELARADATGIRHLVGPRLWDRASLARRIMYRRRLAGELKVERRSQQRWPHLGRVDLRTAFGDHAKVAGIDAVMDEAARLVAADR